MFFSLKLYGTPLLGNRLLKLAGMWPRHQVFFETLFQLDQVVVIWKLHREAYGL